MGEGVRKILVLAVALSAASIWMPVQSADKPVYSIWSPTYRAATNQEMIQSAVDVTNMEAEARSRKLKYALVGLVALFGCIAVFRFVSARRRRIATSADSAFIGTLAAAVSAKRRLGSKIEARIASKAKSSADE